MKPEPSDGLPSTKADSHRCSLAVQHSALEDALSVACDDLSDEFLEDQFLAVVWKGPRSAFFKSLFRKRYRKADGEALSTLHHRLPRAGRLDRLAALTGTMLLQ